jgi:Na+/H+ antiporter NhaC
LNPLSITGIYLTGIIAGAGGSRNLFVQGLCFNFAAILAIVFLLLLIPEALPKTSFLKKAWARVRSGGPLWPEGTDNSGRGDSDGGNRGRVLNLALPIFALIVSSVAAGTLREGSLSVDVLFGMIIALITAFLLYTFQRFMTPENFFDNIIYGIETMLAPVVMFIIGKCFAQGIEELGFSAWLNTTVNSMIGNQGWLLPAIIFGVCTVIGALFDNPWAMYSIGMPIAINLALTTGGPVNLYVGAVCAAGFIGNEIALGDIFFTGPMLGINPIAYYRTKLPYVLTICFAAFTGYAAVGWFLFR